MPQERVQKHTSHSKPKKAEQVEELPTTEKPDLSKIDALLEEIDELLEEETVAEAMAKALAKTKYKEKLKSLHFATGGTAPLSLLITTQIVCEFRCANCTCGR